MAREYSEDKKMWFRFLDPGGFIYKDPKPKEEDPTYLGDSTPTAQTEGDRDWRAEKAPVTQTGTTASDSQQGTQGMTQQLGPQQDQQSVGQMQNQEQMNIQKLIAGLTDKEQSGPTSFSITPSKTGGYSYKIDGMAGNDSRTQIAPQQPQSSPVRTAGTTDDFLKDYGG